MVGGIRHPAGARVQPRALAGRVLALAVAGAFAAYLTAAVHGAVRAACSEVAQAARAHESLRDGRTRLFGERYTSAIDQIRDALAPDESYLLVEGGHPASGGAYWVRYDLAPRRAVYLGKLDELTSPAQVRRRLTANLRHVVLTFDTGKSPRLYERYRFLQEIGGRAGSGTGAAEGDAPDSARPAASRPSRVPAARAR